VSTQTGSGATQPTASSGSCIGADGGGSNGLGFSGPISYTVSNTIAGSATVDQLTWGVAYDNPNVASSSYTGSLRVRLWAVTSNYAGGSISGYVLSEFNPSFTGSGAESADQLYNDSNAINIHTIGTSSSNPSAGTYCVVATLEQYVNGMYVISDWDTFPSTATFQ